MIEQKLSKAREDNANSALFLGCALCVAPGVTTGPCKAQNPNLRIDGV
jgi:hypothetical protein